MMILRSLTKAIREQNYYAVFIEFVIVIFGVVIGFQVTTWNEARQAQAREADYLLQLDRELTAVIEDLGEGKAATDAYFRWITLFMDGVREGDPEKAQAGSWGLNAITDIEIVNLEPAALREMISAGELGLIRDRELRAELASIPQLQSRSQASLEQAILTVTPVAFEIARHFETRLEDVADLTNPAFTTETVRFDFEAVSADAEFLRLLNYAALQNRFTAAHYLRYTGLVTTIRDHVRDEIETRGLQ